MNDQDPQRKSTALFWLCFLPVLLVTLWMLWRFTIRRNEEEPSLTPGGFNIPEAPKTDDSRTQNFPLPSSASRTNSVPPMPTIGGLDRGSSSSGISPQEAAARRKEQEFINKYGAIVHGVDYRIQGSVRKYARKYPIINQFAADYNQMGQIRGAYRQYAKDGNFYQYVRSVSASPETKQLVMKYVSNPAAWKAGFAVTLDVLKTPPPAPVYSELLKTLMSDRVAARNTSELLSPILSNFPAMALQAVPAGADMKPMQGFFGDATGDSSNSDVALVSSDYNNSYWAGFQKGYAEGLARRGKK